MDIRLVLVVISTCNKIEGLSFLKAAIKISTVRDHRADTFLSTRRQTVLTVPTSCLVTRKMCSHNNETGHLNSEGWSKWVDSETRLNSVTDLFPFNEVKVENIICFNQSTIIFRLHLLVEWTPHQIFYSDETLSVFRNATLKIFFANLELTPLGFFYHLSFIATL